MKSEGKESLESGIAAHEQLGTMIGGFFVTQMIFVATRFGLPDMLHDGPRTVGEMADELNVNSDALGRLLRALSSVGIFCPAGNGAYEHTELSALLKSNGPSMRQFALWAGGEWTWGPFGSLEHSVRTGEPAFEKVFKCDVNEYLVSNPEAAGVFSAVMTERMIPVASAVASACAVADGNKVVDVGGGNGHLLAAILKANPGSHGVLFDLPSSMKGARRFLEQCGLHNRCDYQQGDFFDQIPIKGDTLILSNVVHDWCDDLVIKLLENCRKCLSKTGRLLLVEYILPEGENDVTPHPAKISDLIMLITSGGMERTETQFRYLLTKAGFELLEIRPTAAGWCVLEGRVSED